MSAHLFLKAVQLSEGDPATWKQQPGTFDQAMWAFRRAFFRECRDISHLDVQREIAAGLGVDTGAIEKYIHSGAAFAALAADYQEAEKLRIEGSPSLVLNQGRQKLYGNILADRGQRARPDAYTCERRRKLVLSRLPAALGRREATESLHPRRHVRRSPMSRTRTSPAGGWRCTSSRGEAMRIAVNIAKLPEPLHNR
jgi:DSBA-like thioredoxin domain-containing protein